MTVTGDAKERRGDRDRALLLENSEERCVVLVVAVGVDKDRLHDVVEVAALLLHAAPSVLPRLPPSPARSRGGRCDYRCVRGATRYVRTRLRLF